MVLQNSGHYTPGYRCEPVGTSAGSGLAEADEREMAKWWHRTALDQVDTVRAACGPTGEAAPRWTRHGKSGLGARLNSGGSPIACALKPFHDLGRIIELICEETNYVTTLSHTRDGAPSQAATRVCKEPACRTQLTDNLTHT
jgi:hypothetical protein